MRNGARKKADNSRIARVGDVNHVGSVECFPAVRLDWFSERGALPSSSPSNGRTPQSPAAPQTTGTAAPDSGEGPSPLSSDDPTALNQGTANSK